jgi:hypothetical protein
MKTEKDTKTGGHYVYHHEAVLKKVFRACSFAHRKRVRHIVTSLSLTSLP